MRNLALRWVRTAAAVAGCGVLSSIAAADTIEMLRIGNGLGRQITRHGVAMPPGGLDIFIGEFINDFRNGNGVAAGYSGVHRNFCIDLVQEHSPNWEVFDVVPLPLAPVPPPAMGGVRAQAIADAYLGAGAGAHSSADNAAAMQMLIWEIIGDFDGTLASIDINAGNVRYSSGEAYFASVVAAFNAFKSMVGSGAPLGDLYGVVHPDFQDHMILIPGPGAGALAGAAMLLAARRRRRNRA
jgi:hypothetical protein